MRSFLKSLFALFFPRVLAKSVQSLDERADRLIVLASATESATSALNASLAAAVQLCRITEERTRVLEKLLLDQDTLSRITEERTRSLLYHQQVSHFLNEQSQEFLRTWYIENALRDAVTSSAPGAIAAKFIHLDTEHPVASNSNDHLQPDSTVEGVVRPIGFVRQCIKLLGPDIRCLDLGTGGAGLVFEFVMNGVMAIGVDGSDYCRENKIGYWPLLPYNLRTCDITKPFSFLSEGSGEQVRFDIITAWEVLEHIKAADLAPLFENIRRHLLPGGYFLGSISLLEYLSADGTPYHVTIEAESWWRERFLESGLVMIADQFFDSRQFCRGNGPRFNDMHNYEKEPYAGFHFVARCAPPI